MMTLKHLKTVGTHNFLLNTGKTFAGTPAGVWGSYIAPRGKQEGVLTMLYATKESRIHAPAIIGLIGLHSLHTYGELPVGSDNLSCHSIRIQNKLAKVLGQLSVDAPINKDNWFSSIENNDYLTHMFNDNNADELDLDLLRQGKTFILDVMKNPDVVQMELPFHLEV